MTDDRLLVAQAVFNGLIGEEHLTIEEIDEFGLMVADAAMEQEMDAAMERGCAVFAGYENQLIH